MNALGKALVAFVLFVELAVIGAGVFLIVEQQTGIPARATVTDCVPTGLRGTDCTGSWTIGGSLVGGGGHVVVGTVQGAVSSDVGKTIDVSVSGDTAYIRSLVLPIVLIGLGVLLAPLTGRALFRSWHRT